MKEEGTGSNYLIDKLDILLKKQESLSTELHLLKEEIIRIKNSEAKQVIKEEGSIEEPKAPAQPVQIIQKKETVKISTNLTQAKGVQQKSVPDIEEEQLFKANIEKFIGENLINKIGIAITVIGVSIGAKYAIDHQLISPLTRILLGYLVGAGLLAFAIRLKNKYENFSSVLLSGAMAIMYFITYAAFSFYSLLPQIVAFLMMVVITVFTVTASLQYNRQVIAHIGLVGAYAVPFLLSEGSEKVVVLFSYITIINIGILFIAFKKYWKLLYYSSFLMTWLIFLTWFGSKYQDGDHFAHTMTFLTVFFVTFYLMFLVYKLLQKEKFDIYDIVLLLANSFIFYGIGYNILTKNNTGEHLLGLFTLINAVLHFVVSLLIYRQKLADRNLFFMVSGLAVIFITIAIPVQLNGNWITLLWAGEASLLFWIGRTRKVNIYEILSYFIMLLAFFSILRDWSMVYNTYDPIKPGTRITMLFNINFLTSLLFISSFAFINIVHRKPEYPSPLSSNKDLMDVISFSIPAIFLMCLYFAIQMEISTYWNQLYKDSSIEINKDGLSHGFKYWNNDLTYFKTIWSINYSLVFFSVLSWANIKLVKNKNLGFVNLALNGLIIVVFLTAGLFFLSELRDSFLNKTPNDLFQRSIFNIGIRYIVFLLAGIVLFSIYMYINQGFMAPINVHLKIPFDILLYTCILWVVSSEMITWMDIMHYSQSYKLGLSILWGIYALILIILGIWKKKRHLRIGAIALFMVTLIKLFLYDISHLGTIQKTIIFISLGILLLIISFLYIKYRNIISYEPDNGK
jgi:uncharacterized membrane protein